MKATEFLQRSAETLTKRGETYDKKGGERSMPAAVTAWNAITRKEITEAEGWLLLQLIKDVRLFTGAYHEDSALDCVGYAALKAEAAVRGYLEYPEEEGPIARKIRAAAEKHLAPKSPHPWVNKATQEIFESHQKRFSPSYCYSCGKDAHGNLYCADCEAQRGA